MSETVWVRDEELSRSVGMRGGYVVQGRVPFVLDDPRQPFYCYNTNKCMHCKRRMIEVHYHCCGKCIHLTGASGKCYEEHLHEHWITGRLDSHTKISPLLEPLRGFTGGSAKLHLAYRRDTCFECPPGLWSPGGQGYHVDHWDGNHKNNHPSNLVTRCGRHHYLKTKVRGEYRPLDMRKARPLAWER